MKHDPSGHTLDNQLQLPWRPNLAGGYSSGMIGLPGGSSGEGPATLAGLLFVASCAVALVAGLVWFLFHAI